MVTASRLSHRKPASSLELSPAQGNDVRLLEKEQLNVIRQWSTRPSQQANAEHYSQALTKLAELATLVSDWDSYGARAISPTAIETATDVLWMSTVYSAGRFGTELPGADVVPVADGGVQLEWSTEDSLLEIEIGPAGRASYLLAIKGRDPVEGKASVAEVVGLLSLL